MWALNRIPLDPIHRHGKSPTLRHYYQSLADDGVECRTEYHPRHDGIKPGTNEKLSLFVNPHTRSPYHLNMLHHITSLLYVNVWLIRGPAIEVSPLSLAVRKLLMGDENLFH